MDKIDNSGKSARKLYLENYYKINKERIDKQNAEWRKNNPEKFMAAIKDWQAKNKERYKKYHKEYYEKNKDKYAARGREWAEKNRERWLAYSSEYRRINRDSGIERTARYKAKKINATPQNLSPSEIAEIRFLYGLSKAVSCGGVKHHVDHFYPVSRGGTHSPQNLRVIPAIVNLRKSAKILPEALLDGTRIHKCVPSNQTKPSLPALEPN